MDVNLTQIALSTEVVDSNTEFSQIRDEWNTLATKCSHTTTFLTFDWLETWWQTFEDSNELYIILIRDQHDSLMGIAPFYIHTSRTRPKIRSLRLLGTEPISSDYLDILSIDELSQETVQAISARLLEDSSLWDQLVLNDILEDSLCLTILLPLLEKQNYTHHVLGTRTCPYRTLPESHTALLGEVAPRLRSTIKRKTKKLTRSKVYFKCALHTDDTEKIMAELFELHQRCWNVRGKPGSFKRDIIKSFHQNVALKLSQSSLLHLYTLSSNEGIIAALYAFRHGDTLYYYQSGYDPAWDKFSPGTVLMSESIRDAIEQGVKEFDFLRGDEPYKKLWTNTHRKTVQLVTHSRSNYYLQVFYAVQQLKTMLKRKLKMSFASLCARVSH